MTTAVFYKTKGGATEKYARWMAEGTEGKLIKFEEVGRNFDFGPYEQVIVSSGTYAGLMPLTRFLKKHWKQIAEKNVFVVAVGAAPADDKWSLWSYNRIPARIREKITYFKLMGEDPEAARPEGYVSKVKKENLEKVFESLNK